MSTDFQRSLASSFSSIGDVAALARSSASPISISPLVRGDLASIIGTRPQVDIGSIVHGGFGTLPTPTGTPVSPALTPIDAGVFIGTIAQTPEQTLTAAVHAARTAFEAIPTAQDGDVIDASIPNAFRSAMITLLSLAEAAIHQLFQQQPPRPVPVQPPPVTITPPVTAPPPTTMPPVTTGPGIIHIDPSVIPPLVGPPGPDPMTATPSLPSIDLGGRIFDAQTITHPETGTSTTVLVERAPAVSGTSVDLTPVAGGGFYLTPSVTQPAGESTAVGGISATGLAGIGTVLP